MFQSISKISHIIPKVLLLIIGPFMLVAAFWPSQIASSQSSTVHFVDKTGQPLANERVHVFCYSQLKVFINEIIVQTNAAGQPAPDLPAHCAFLAAFQWLHEQPSGKPGHGPAYTVYYTSWSPYSGAALLPANGPILISDEWPLVLFNVVASLEWTPPDNAFIEDLRAGLDKASAYLYDLSEGQLAFGPITIHTGGQAWESADLRFLAANDYRPTAQVGGMVPMTTTYVAPETGAETIYAPGAIYLGRYWDGRQASAGFWSGEEGYRTLVHEWGHYALFLYDGYEEASSAFCTCTDLPQVTTTPDPEVCGGVTTPLAMSAMAYHYTASEFWSNESGAVPNACFGIDQWQVHGLSDWDTLGRWSTIQGLPTEWLRQPAQVTAGPQLPPDLFGAASIYQVYLPVIQKSSIRTSAAVIAATSDLTVTLTTDPPFSPADFNATYPQVYLAAPTKIIYQGTTTQTHRLGGDGATEVSSTLGQITLLGVENSMQAKVFVDRYTLSGAPTSGGRFIYLPPASPPPLTHGQTLDIVSDDWPANLDVDYKMTGLRLTAMTLTVTNADGLPLGTPPTVQLCTPGADPACFWQQSMQSNDGFLTWTATYTAPAEAELPVYSLLHVQAAGVGEIVRWIQDGGGLGPFRKGGHAPLRDGLVMVDATLPETVAGPSRVMIMPAANYEALLAPLPSEIEGLVDTPIDLDVILGDGGNPDAVEADLTFFYGDEIATEPALVTDAIQLCVLRFIPGAGWQSATSTESADGAWPATDQVSPSGIYAIGWTSTICPTSD